MSYVWIQARNYFSDKLAVIQAISAISTIEKESAGGYHPHLELVEACNLQKIVCGHVLLCSLGLHLM